MAVSLSISSSNPLLMKRLLLSLLLLFIGLLATDRFGAVLMKHVAYHSRDVLAPKLRTLQDGVSADVVLLGASRCHHHYVPSIMADSLGMSVYNAGVGGSDNIYSHYLVLCHLLRHHTPRIVCLELMPSDYQKEADPFHALSFFAPLFGQCSQADSLYMLAGSYWKYRLSHLYRYNAKATSNILGLFINRQSLADNGYIPLPQPAKTLQGPEREGVAVLGCDSQKLTFLRRFIALCRQQGILLVFTVSPRLTEAPDSLYMPLKVVAREAGIPFLDYHGQHLYHDHPEYFKDGLHLWDHGARLFTMLFASDLKPFVLGK